MFLGKLSKWNFYNSIWYLSKISKCIVRRSKIFNPKWTHFSKIRNNKNESITIQKDTREISLCIVKLCRNNTQYQRESPLTITTGITISPATVYSSIKNVKNTLNESVTIQFDTSTIRRNIAVYRHYLHVRIKCPACRELGFQKFEITKTKLFGLKVWKNRR